MTSSQKVGETLTARAPELAAAVVHRHYELHPENAQAYGTNGRVKCTEDAAYHIRYLAEALSVGEPELFADYVSWAKVMLAARSISATDLADNLRVLWDVLIAELPADSHATIARCIGAALDRIHQYPTELTDEIRDDEPHHHLARQYLQSLLRGERESASRLIIDAARSGIPVQELYTFVFERTQQEIGRLWQLNRISVAHEHYCTAATQLIISQLYPYVFGGEKDGRQAVAACPTGELHELGARMICDFLELDGWNTTYLGANVPTRDLLRMLEERQPALLALSATMTFHINHVRQTIGVVREAFSGKLKIMVGGYVFRRFETLWREIGADGFASDARQAVVLASQLAQLEER